MILLALAMGVWFFRGKIGRKQKVVFISGAVLALVVLEGIMKLDIQRLAALDLNAPSLNGRLLFYVDGLAMIMKNPLGLGYMGYAFWLPQYQTGLYSTKFVHNLILQTALDAGVLAMIAIVIVLAAGLFSKKSEEWKKVLLLFLFLHALFDFDQQFSVMMCMLVMCLDTKNEKQWQIKGVQVPAVSVMITVVGMYLTIALGASYMGNDELSLKLYPHNTYAQIKKIQTNGDSGAVYQVIEENR